MTCTSVFSDHESDWTDIRKTLADAHDAIQKAREDAVPRYWCEQGWPLGAASILVLVGLFLFEVGMLAESANLAASGMFMALIFVILTFTLLLSMSAHERVLAQSYDPSFSEAELQIVATLPIHTETPGWDGWMAAAADHRLGLADLKAVVAAIDAQQAEERRRQVLRHQNQIIFRDQETRGSTA